MKIYRVLFRQTSKEWSSGDKFFVHKKENDKVTDINNVLFTRPDGSVLVLEKDLSKYWNYGGKATTTAQFITGPEEIKCLGELDDAFFKPSLAEPDFIDNQIRSRSTSEVLGYQV